MKSFMSEVEQTENSQSKFEAAFMEKGGKQTLSDMAA